MVLLYVVIAALLLGALFFLIMGYVVFKRVCKRKAARPNTFEAIFSQSKISLATRERLLDDFNWFNTAPSEEIIIESEEGLRLYARAIRADEGPLPPRGIILMFHGYRSSGVRDMCLQMRMLHNEGYHILAVDQRSHGRSDGKYICYGIKERLDATRWVKKATELFGESLPICLMGLSMGGATVLMASELAERENARVRCVIADCPFSSPKDIVAHVLKTRHGLKPYPLLYFIDIWCRLLAKFTLKATSSAKAVSVSSLPILLFHGDADDYVPTRLSKDIQSVAPERIRLVIVDKAAHGEAIFCNEKLYKSETLSFLDEYMK